MVRHLNNILFGSDKLPQIFARLLRREFNEFWRKVGTVFFNNRFKNYGIVLKLICIFYLFNLKLYLEPL